MLVVKQPFIRNEVANAETGQDALQNYSLM